MFRMAIVQWVCIGFFYVWSQTIFVDFLVCKSDEVYNECGSACPPTCDNPEPNCIKSCEKGCFCKKGLIRNDSGKCVEKSCCGPFTKNPTIL